MSRATPKMRDFAECLIAYDARENKSSGTPVDHHVLAKLRPHLATLMGNGGFRSLLARSLVLATMEAAWLRDVRVKPDGTLEGWEGLEAKINAKEMAEGKIVLLAHVLGLLVAFIGELLTVRLVRDVWPKAQLDDLNFGNGGKNEKTK